MLVIYNTGKELYIEIVRSLHTPQQLQTVVQAVTQTPLLPGHTNQFDAGSESRRKRIDTGDEG